MKRILTLILALVMLLSMTACGGSAETAPAATQPQAANSAPAAAQADKTTPAEEPEAAPAEEPDVFTVYELAEGESYEEVVWNHDFWELDLDADTELAAEYYATGSKAIPLSLELSRTGFRMEVDYAGYDYMSGRVIPYGTVEVIGAKADGLADISGLNPEDYQEYGQARYEADGVMTDYGIFADGHILETTYWYFNVDANGVGYDNVFVFAHYYPTTDSLYNVIYRFETDDDYRSEPHLLYGMATAFPGSPYYPKAETLSYGDFSFEMNSFAIQCGTERYIYNYRPGMSLSDWACSELNTDGWIPWYGDEVLSPDRKYSASTGYLDMQESMEWYGHGNVIIAEEYDGKTNYLSNDGTLVEASGFDLSGLNLNGGSVAVISGDVLNDLMTQNGLSSTADLQNYLQANGTGGLPTAQLPTNGNGELSLEDLVSAGATEEAEIAENGNISVPVAHMVNAKTPLFTPGFRIISKEGGLAAYHSVEMSYDLLREDILDIYMNGIADELIPHIKLYAFSESEEFLKSLEGHTILNAHPTPFEQDNAMLTIPDDALCLTFERVADGKEAPNSPNPRRPGHENLNKDAVYARYVTKNDPNFSPDNNLVFAITFDDVLVYWIHMGANFNESNNTEWVENALPY